jgi:hypothetical protein
VATRHHRQWQCYGDWLREAGDADERPPRALHALASLSSRARAAAGDLAVERQPEFLRDRQPHDRGGGASIQQERQRPGAVDRDLQQDVAGDHVERNRNGSFARLRQGACGFEPAAGKQTHDERNGWASHDLVLVVKAQARAAVCVDRE